jgi:hypothetical protein
MFFPSKDEDSVTGGNSTAPADSEIAVDSDNVLAMEHDVSLSPPATLSNNRPIKRTAAMLNVLQNDLVGYSRVEKRQRSVCTQPHYLIVNYLMFGEIVGHNSRILRKNCVPPMSKRSCFTLTNSDNTHSCSWPWSGSCTSGVSILSQC